MADDQLKSGARVVVVYSGFEADSLDSITVVRLGEHLERLTSRDLRALETSVPFETLKAIVDVAVEIGREGREGKAVGTLLGRRRRPRRADEEPDSGVRPVPRIPPQGPQSEGPSASARRSRRSPSWTAPSSSLATARSRPRARSSTPPTTGLTLPKGLGTRHWTAAAITNVTSALAIVVSQSTGTVRIFQEGEIILRIAPMRHARAMKWIEDEVEHAPERPK